MFSTDCYIEHWHTVISNCYLDDVDIIDFDVQNNKAICRICVSQKNEMLDKYYCFMWKNVYAVSWVLEEQPSEYNYIIIRQPLNCCKNIGLTRLLKNSNWLKQISDDFKNDENIDIKHFLLITGWETIEILSDIDPEIKEF